MTERNPALWLQQRTDHTAEQERALLTTLIRNEGVAASGSLAVSQRSAGANMSVDVAAGMAFVKGDDNANQGFYHVWNDDVKNLTITAADGTNPRRDLIVARVKDAYYSGATNAFSLEVITGTPAGSPSDPTIPNNALVLARVAVAAGATSITNANITDLRERVVLNNKSWDTAWGIVGSAAKATDQSGITTVTDVTSLSVTFTAVPGRRYRTHLYLPVVTQASATGFASPTITDGSNAIKAQSNRLMQSGDQDHFNVWAVETGLSGSTTRKGRLTTSAGTVSITATSAVQALILVEDIGPA